MDNVNMIAESLIKIHEGLSLTLYADSLGKPTIGWGRELRNHGITKAEAQILLTDDVNYLVSALEMFAWFSALDDVRKAAIVDMAFNLGLKGLLQFSNMIAALEKKDWSLAAICMMQSRWATQVGQRSIDLSNIIRTGELTHEENG